MIVAVILNDAANCSPFFLTKVVSVEYPSLFAFALSSQLATCPKTTIPGENTETRFFPITSSAEYPNSFSALGLKVSILPSRSQVITLTISRVSDMILPMFYL